MIYLFLNRKLESLLMLTLIAVLVLAASPALAEDGEKSWQPPPPMPDDFDWIQLTSGEWLKGKMVSGSRARSPPCTTKSSSSTAKSSTS